MFLPDARAHHFQKIKKKTKQKKKQRKEKKMKRKSDQNDKVLLDLDGRLQGDVYFQQEK
jgi:hypothetical protein